MTPPGHRLKIRNRILYEGLKKLGIAVLGIERRLPRDSQRKRLYNAEDALLSAMASSRAKHLCSEVAMLRLINKVLNNPDILAKFPSINDQDVLRVDIALTPRKKAGVAIPEKWQVQFSDKHSKEGCWDRLIVLHELAHLLHFLADPEFNTPLHGSVYAGIYLYLVGKFMGKCWRDRLKRNFDVWKVHYHEVL